MATLKIAVLWNTLTGYLNVCLRSLAETPGVSLFVSDHVGESKQAPFADEMFAWIENRYSYREKPEAEELMPRLADFDPDVLLVASWNSKAYRVACRHYRGRAVRICGIDNQWQGTPKQWLGRLTSSFFVQPMFDAALVSGERQAEFARRIGFTENQIWRGLYAGNVDAFAYPGKRTLSPEPRAFLFTGRLSEEKGIDTLLDAYRLYRRAEDRAGRMPWALRIVGSGSGASLQGHAGVEHLGFVQPPDLPKVFAAADCFVLPSRWEPWGVVLHEAAAASLPILCTTACGASVHLVADGYNGLLVGRNDPSALASAMSTISTLSPQEYERMAEASVLLSRQLTPERWATYVLRRSREAQSALPRRN